MHLTIRGSIPMKPTFIKKKWKKKPIEEDARIWPRKEREFTKNPIPMVGINDNYHLAHFQQDSKDGLHNKRN